jgi:hypothetical protein
MFRGRRDLRDRCDRPRRADRALKRGFDQRCAAAGAPILLSAVHAF